jgi:hypothetical protein
LKKMQQILNLSKPLEVWVISLKILNSLIKN